MLSEGKSIPTAGDGFDSPKKSAKSAGPSLNRKSAVTLEGLKIIRSIYLELVVMCTTQL